MNTVFRATLLTAALLAGCQGGVGGKSQYADQQSRSSYLNTPAYLNVQLGSEYMKANDFALALVKLEKALSYDPNLAIAHSTIAVLYGKMGEAELAEKHFKRSIALDANDPRLRNNYGQHLCQHGRARASLDQFKLAADNPLYAAPEIALTNAGSCAMRIEQWQQSELFFRQALQRQPKMTLALLGMLRLSVHQEKYLQGRAYIQRYKAVAAHTAETLWAGYQIEKNLGDKAARDNYAVRLKTRFPDSAQTMKLLEEISR